MQRVDLTKLFPNPLQISASMAHLGFHSCLQLPYSMGNLIKEGRHGNVQTKRRMGIFLERGRLPLVSMPWIVTPLSRGRGDRKRQGLRKAWLPPLAGEGEIPRR